MAGTAYLIVKLLVSAVLIVLITEIAKRSSLLGALLASLPLVSLLSFIWLYLETHDTGRIASLSTGIFWLVLPSLVLVLVLPLLLRWGWNFWLSLLAASFATVLAYFFMLAALKALRIHI